MALNSTKLKTSCRKVLVSQVIEESKNFYFSAGSNCVKSKSFNFSANSKRVGIHSDISSC